MKPVSVDPAMTARAALLNSTATILPLRQVAQSCQNHDMTAAISDILTQTKDGEAAAVVSHAAAICAYLQQYCTITVTDAGKKLRRITFSGATVLNGPISTPSCFVLRFEDGVLSGIEYVGI